MGDLMNLAVAPVTERDQVIQPRLCMNLVFVVVQLDVLFGAAHQTRGHPGLASLPLGVGP